MFGNQFSPLSLSGLQLWLDALDVGTITLQSSQVTAWRDKSGNNKNITIGNTSGSAGLTYGNASGNVNAANSVNTAQGQTSYFTVAVDIRKNTTPSMTMFIVYAWLGQPLSQDLTTFWGNDVPNAANRVQFFRFTSYAPNNFG